jgi:hypothetical protein
VYLNETKCKRGNIAISSEAIERRHRLGLKIESTDFSLDTLAVETLSKYGSIGIVSRWLHAVEWIDDHNLIDEIKKWSFVTKVELLNNELQPRKSSSKLECLYTELEYGPTYSQIAMHHGNLFHDQGYKGLGIKIAVFDAGFPKVDSMPIFQHLFANHRIFPVQNIVDQSSSLFVRNSHGTSVLGCLASYIKDTIIGSAPEATYYLFITEDADHESKLEELNWTRAAEIADSMGLDLITSSLGYSRFDDPSTDYSPTQLDGKTTIVSRAANIAVSKGIIVVNAAGNEGGSSWKRITPPADVANVLAVGSVDFEGHSSAFSSIGPNTLSQIKPDICGVGQGTIVGYDQGHYISSNGTSFATPVLSGLIACFMQKYPQITPDVLRASLRRSSSLFLHPTNAMGFGIPDFRLLDQYSSFFKIDTIFKVYPNPSHDYIVVQYHPSMDEELSIAIRSFEGTLFQPKFVKYNELGFIHVYVGDLARGMYLMDIVTPSINQSLKIVLK